MRRYTAIAGLVAALLSVGWTYTNTNQGTTSATIDGGTGAAPGTRIQLRRDTNTNRLLVTPRSGECFWTTDTTLLYCGDGTTAGGVLVTGSGASSNVDSLDDLSDVTIASPASGNTLKYSSATGLWTPGMIQATNIAGEAITAGKIASNAVVSANITDGTITGADILDSTIMTADIGANTITAADIATDAIETTELNDGSDSPVAGECLKVATDTSAIEYGSCAGTVSAYDTIYDEASALTQRNDLFFIGDLVACVDSPTGTQCTIDVPADTISTAMLQGESVTTDVLADNSVGTGKVADSSLLASDMYPGEVAIVDGVSGGQTICGSTLTAEHLTLRPNCGDNTTGQIKLGTGAAYDATESCLAAGKQTCTSRASQSGIMESQVNTAATDSAKTGLYVAHRSSGVPVAGFGANIAIGADNGSNTETNIGAIEWAWSDATAASEDANTLIKAMQAGSLTTVVTIDSTGKVTPVGGVTIESNDEFSIGGSQGLTCKRDSALDLVKCIVDSGSSFQLRSNSYTGDLIANFTSESSSSENFEAYYNGSLILETLPDGIGLYGTQPLTFDDGSFNACDSLGTSAGVLSCNTGFTGTFTYDPGSLADGVGETKAFTCTGATTGNIVTVGPGVDLQDMIFSAYVQATNACEVRLQNESGAGPIDLASSTWSYHVRQ